MAEYILALVPKPHDGNGPPSCIGCALAPGYEYEGCKFRELCGTGILEAKLLQVDPGNLIPLELK